MFSVVAMDSCFQFAATTMINHEDVTLSFKEINLHDAGEDKEADVQTKLTPNGWYARLKLKHGERTLKAYYGWGDIHPLDLASKLERKSRIYLDLKTKVTIDENGLKYQIPVLGVDPANIAYEKFGRFVQLIMKKDPKEVIADLWLPEPPLNEDFKRLSMRILNLCSWGSDDSRSSLQGYVGDIQR